MIAGLIEGNLLADPRRQRLLSGSPRTVTISAEDLDASVSLVLGGGAISVSEGIQEEPKLWIRADAATLIELPNAKLLAGLPSIMHASGRKVLTKLVRGDMKVKGLTHLALLSRVQRLLSVS